MHDGELTDRKILWEATYPEVAAAVFEKMYEMVQTEVRNVEEMYRGE